MQEVTVGSIPLSRLGAILPAERLAKLEASAVRARADFGDRVIWHVNATAHGGGVAEMLQTLLAYGNGARIVNRWLVIDGDHGVLRDHQEAAQQAARDSGRRRPPRPSASTPTTRQVLADNLAQLVSRVSPRDLVMLHDPQTAGLREGLRDSGVRVIWRCHIGCDDTERAHRRGVVVPAAVRRGRRRVRVLAARLRAVLGRRPAAGRDPAVDRPVLGEELCARRRRRGDGAGPGRPGGRWGPGRAGPTSRGATVRREPCATTPVRRVSSSTATLRPTTRRWWSR